MHKSYMQSVGAALVLLAAGAAAPVLTAATGAAAAGAGGRRAGASRRRPGRGDRRGRESGSGERHLADADLGGVSRWLVRPLRRGFRREQDWAPSAVETAMRSSVGRGFHPRRAAPGPDRCGTHVEEVERAIVEPRPDRAVSQVPFSGARFSTTTVTPTRPASLAPARHLPRQRPPAVPAVTRGAAQHQRRAGQHPTDCM